MLHRLRRASKRATQGGVISLVRKRGTSARCRPHVARCSARLDQAPPTRSVVARIGPGVVSVCGNKGRAADRTACAAGAPRSSRQVRWPDCRHARDQPHCANKSVALTPLDATERPKMQTEGDAPSARARRKRAHASRADECARVPGERAPEATCPQRATISWAQGLRRWPNARKPRLGKDVQDGRRSWSSARRGNN